ncbi:MAG: exo-alpha-sialidase [Acidimicrobiia bacterium]|nr:exo-alpha-sialidase [Acidimicrobiia bacterium]
MTEASIAEISPGSFLAAIRTDEAPEPASTPSAFDGFYLSRSHDGIHWSTPESLAERGRMPRFYRFGDLWALAYRLYNGSQRIQHSAIRFSRDGKSWTGPVIVEDGVAVHPELVEVQGRIIAFNYLLPYGSEIGTRNVLSAPEFIYEQTGTSKPRR